VTYTDASGHYTLPGLYAGTYNIIASKESWASDAEEVTLSSGQDMTGVDFTLTPVAITEVCESPSLSIPDNNAAGVRDTCAIAADGATVSGVEVFIDITHTYIGDLIVELTSPVGTTVVLHNRTGGTAENIYGWYPGEIVPAGDLGDFIGDPTDGKWILHVSDNAGIDLGVLNDWCVRLTHDIATDVGGAAENVPSRLALKGNVPNPFNPVTTIYFDLPKKMNVSLAVYEPSGRRVATLRSGEIEAGSHQVTWDGRDDSGREVSSGVYFYRLEAEKDVMTRKMVLLK
jgi:subtilisin-like proprotein convertase family protein